MKEYNPIIFANDSYIYNEEHFEVVSKYKDKNINIPKRATKGSAGYDIEAAEDIVVPSIYAIIRRIKCSEPHLMYGSGAGRTVSYFACMEKESQIYTIEEIKDIVKKLKLVTMVPTGLKIKLQEDKFLALHTRSSIGVNCLLMLPNQTGIIDSDYYNNSDNEGHIMVPMINLSPYNILIKKGDRIAQGIVQKYYRLEEDKVTEIRDGGCGSTGIATALDESVHKTEYVNPIEYEPAEAAYSSLYENDPNIKYEIWATCDKEIIGDRETRSYINDIIDEHLEAKNRGE